MLLEDGNGCEADPGHAPGDDRRAHRPAAAQGEDAAPARGGGRADLLGRARSRSSRPRSRSSSASSTTCSCATSSCGRAAPRSPARRAYRFKHVLIRDVAYAGPDEGGARRPAPAASRSGWRSGPGRSCSRSAPTTSIRPRRCSRSSTARRRRSSPRRPPPRSRRPASARWRARRTRPAAGSCSARSSSSRRSSGATRPRARPGGSTICRRCRSRWRTSAQARARPATSGCEGRALTALAEVALSATRTSRGRARSPTRRSTCCPRTTTPGRYDALALLSQIGWWEGDLDRRRALRPADARDRAACGPQGSRERALQSSSPRCTTRGSRTSARSST